MYEIYGAEWCSFCVKAKQLLDDGGIEYKYYDIDKDDDAYGYLKVIGAKTIPVVLKNGNRIGGYNELENMIGGN